MQLVHAGRIDLEAPLRTYLPEAPVGPTVRMALSHLTGVQREPPGEIWESMQPPTREELIAGLEDAELVLRPGELWHYSNLVFALLGEIVMRVTGESYADVLQRRILDPLGLARTSLRPDAPKASPYYVDPYADTVRDEPDPEVTESTGAAGWLWSTPADLARWGVFIADGDDAVLPRAALDRMARPQTMVDEVKWSLGWGLGLELYRRGDRVFAGHGGAMPGFLAGLVVQRARANRCSRAHEHERRGRPGGARPRACRRRTRRAATDAGAVGAGSDDAARARRRARPLVDGGRGDRPLDARGPLPRRRSWEELPVATSRGSSRTAPTAGASSKAASAASSCAPCATTTARSTKLYFATYPLTRTPTTFG